MAVPAPWGAERKVVVGRAVLIAALAVLALLVVLLLTRFIDPTPNAESAVNAPPAPNAPSDPVHAPHFVDRFQSLDEERWAVSDGWSNGDWVANDWRRDRLRLTSNGLAIVMGDTPAGAEKPYASGEISTHDTYRYGYFEARLRMPRGEGLVVGLFTFARPQGAVSWNEIDMELLGRDTRTLELTYHSGGRPKKHEVRLPFDAAEGFHTYAFEWRPDAIRWYVDNVLVHEARGAMVERMDQEQRFMVNLWNSNALHRWVGDIDPAQAPWTLEVACVAQAGAYRGRSLCMP
jgi:beta-glucanase (GH16 family)